jgi:hypothetical protein
VRHQQKYHVPVFIIVEQLDLPRSIFWFAFGSFSLCGLFSTGTASCGCLAQVCQAPQGYQSGHWEITLVNVERLGDVDKVCNKKMCEVFFASVAWEVYIGCVERWRYVLETPHQCRSVKGCNAWTSSDIRWFVNTPYKFKSELLCAKHASDAKIKHVDYYLRRKTSKLSRTSQAPFEAMAQRDRAAKSVGRGLYVYFVKRVIKFLVKEYNDFLSLCTTWGDSDLCNKANCGNRFLLFNLSITRQVRARSKRM